MDALRRKILERLNTLDTNPTEDERRVERRTGVRRAIEAEETSGGNGLRPATREA
jgi:hypothetical protein